MILKLFSRLYFIIIVLQINIAASTAQEYLWPTDASQYLTSSFAEYRPGHFHAGIDIKTWGQVGYQVFAVRDGHIMRIMVSPFGYGKVIYQKLDTGEIVVYAHLDRFNDELDKFVKQEQKHRRVYRVNASLNPNQYPVRKGDLIGYTGATGIGSPHLHFETRDRNNNPINPFLLGYKIVDTIPPKVTGISITPLDVYSRVNSDVIPFIEKPEQSATGNYRLSSIPLISGKIGFAIDCFDQADGVDNTFAVYKLDFYVDGALQFSATYNKFSYDTSHLIDWDRDFRLMSRGKGIFQKLYKEKFNELTFYKPSGSEIGILSCDPRVVSDSWNHSHMKEGLHQFSIELYDFFGNVSTVEGNFIVGTRKNLTASYKYEAPDRLYLSGIQDENGRTASNPAISISTNYGRIWRQMILHTNPAELDSQTMGDESYLLKPIQPFTIIRLQATDDAGNLSLPEFHVATLDSLAEDAAIELSIEKDFYDDYFRLQLTAGGMIQNSPEITVQQIGTLPTQVSFWQTDFNEFVGYYSLIPGKNGPLSIEVNAKNLAGREFNYWDQFE
ncbi:M23 family metallopeptidase, partial [candidate division KSB1 bacterium]|nr:M23 family metallopeptidase [candidate division KSB1 bacterium]